MKRKITRILLLMFLIVLIANNVFATSLTSNFTGKINVEGSDTIKNIMHNVLSIVRTVGTGLAILILTVIGIKYMISSAGDRAEIKKNAIPYVIGAVVMVSASTLISIIQNFTTTYVKI